MRWSSDDTHLFPAVFCFSPSSSSSSSSFFFQPVRSCLVLVVIVCLLSRAPSSVGAPVSVRERRADRESAGAARTLVCGTPFTDTASSALLADVVLEGRVRQKIFDSNGPPGVAARYNVSIQVRRHIWKGRERVNRGRKPRKLLIGTFGDVTNDDVVVGDVGGGAVGAPDHSGGAARAGSDASRLAESNCVADVLDGATYIFFLAEAGDRKGRYFMISARPVKKTRRESRTVSRILREGGAQRPQIQRLKGPRSVKTGSSVTLRCKAKAKPNPIFTWLRDGVEIVSKRGQRIKNSKRGSRLKISKADEETSGVYTCRATNAIGEASKNVTVKVTAPELIHIACQKQTYCFNGGTCRYIPDLHQTFCQCPKEWAGHRCEILDPFGPGSDKDKTREASLDFEHTLISVGIVIAVLVFIVICIASYFLANRRRKRWAARRRMKQSLGPEGDRLLDKTDGGQASPFTPYYRPLVQKETQTDRDSHLPYFPPKPDPQHEPSFTRSYPNPSGHILLQDSSFPLSSSPVAAPAITTTTPTTTHTSIITAQPPNGNTQRPVSMERGDLERRELRSRLKAVSADDKRQDPSRTCKAGSCEVPNGHTRPVIADGDSGTAAGWNHVVEHPARAVPASDEDEVDGGPETPSPVTVPALVAVPVTMEVQSQSPAHGEQLRTGAETPLLSCQPAVLQSDDEDEEETRSLLPPEPVGVKASPPQPVMSLTTLPANGEVLESDDELADKPLTPLYISEENLNGNAPDYFGSTTAFSRPALSPPPPYAGPSAASAPRPSDLPSVVAGTVGAPAVSGSMSEDDSTGFLPRTLSSTEASTPLTEGTPQGEAYVFDPCVDSDPNEFDEQFMHGSPRKTTGSYSASMSGMDGKQDYERRLRHVCADQEAIPI